ncbi:MAG: hypothetical protein AABN95_20720 [Acidobacteriota bacterium]
MKRSVLKVGPLALVPSAEESTTHPRERAEPPEDYFEGWLTSVSPEVRERRPGARRALTLEDLIQVRRATIREAGDHRHWPPDVVRRFLVAEVINRK